MQSDCQYTDGISHELFGSIDVNMVQKYKAKERGQKEMRGRAFDFPLKET
jgi:hypothetical protein